MTSTIRIDEQVMEELMKRAVDLGMLFPTPNEVLIPNPPKEGVGAVS